MHFLGLQRDTTLPMRTAGLGRHRVMLAKGRQLSHVRLRQRAVKGPVGVVDAHEAYEIIASATTASDAVPTVGRRPHIRSTKDVLGLRCGTRSYASCGQEKELLPHSAVLKCLAVQVKIFSIEIFGARHTMQD